MAAVSNPSESNTQVVVVVENVIEGELESEFVNSVSQTDCNNRITQDNVWIDGKLVP